MSKACQGQVVIVTAYDYVTGRRGRTADRRRLACETHGARFAGTHGVQIGPAVDDREPGVIAAAVAGWTQTTPETVKVEYHRGSGRWCVTKFGGGAVISGTYWLDLPAECLIEEVVLCAGRELGRRSRLVLTAPWQVAERSATAPVAVAETTPEWANRPWGVSVFENDPPYRGQRPVWCADVVLDQRFPADRYRLGDTGMDLDRAVRTATRELAGHGWLLGQWSWLDNLYATNTAMRLKGASVRVPLR